MNGMIFPRFEHEHILRTGMLTAMRDNSFDYAVLMSSDLSDGIIRGCQVIADAERLIVQPGLVHFAGEVYYIREPISVVYEPTEVYCVLKLRFRGSFTAEGCSCREVDAVCANGLELMDNEMELCRFKLKAGSRLRSKYVDFADYNTEFDTVNIISVPYAGSGSSTLPPALLESFADEAVSYILEPEDRSFVVRAFEREHIMSRKAITAYLALRLGVEFKEYSSQELFELLCRLLEKFRDAGERQIVTVRRRVKNILMD